MADAPTYVETHDDDEPAPAADRRPPTPRWVKVAGSITIGLVLLVAVLILLGGGPGKHGPGRHTGAGGANDQTPSSSVTPANGQTPPSEVTQSGGAGGHKPPADGHGP